MIGATVTAPRNATQPLVKPIRLPKAYVRKARAAPGDRVHAAELGVGQGEQHHRAASDQPRDDRRRAGERGREERSEQPAGADDRPERGEHEPDEADVAPELARGAVRHHNQRLSQLGRWSTSSSLEQRPLAMFADLDSSHNPHGAPSPRSAEPARANADGARRER